MNKFITTIFLIRQIIFFPDEDIKILLFQLNNVNVYSNELFLIELNWIETLKPRKINLAFQIY